MQSRKIIIPVLFLLFITPYAFCQSEVFKPVINNLALYKKKKDLKYLGAAKKSIDSLFTTKADSSDLKKIVYRIVVNSSILYIDSLNTLKQPDILLDQTVKWMDKISLSKKINRFRDEMDFSNDCIANVYIRKGFAYMYTSDFSNAEKAFIKAQEYAPSFKQLNFYIAYSNNKLGNLKDAAKYYDNLISTDSTKAEYIETVSNIYKSIGDTAKALEALQKGRRRLPDDKLLLLDQANIYNNQKNYDALAPLLGTLLANYPNNADIAFVAANCYDHLGLYDKAEPLYLRAIDLNSAAYDPVLNLGVLYFKESLIKKGNDQQKYISQATQLLETANEISPNDARSLEVLQLVYEKTQNKNQLLNVTNKLKELNNQ
ncbi:Tetratricopeptide repeat-containing protein [Mucilaginibacter mallensis]|uniref:Tetratricopeptide repeat-containing protein n=1 Tax=Mucilaginibacter mallensis TaxID=652787 RepID=A0A1H1WD69_MUCMA|nr:tetratricopeptide repeat protein [Mucilaginibacter mallensis]SDS95073.1 Tetratricopeptide repeat-containing protein [Mucilaginibacter mallensis]